MNPGYIIFTDGSVRRWTDSSGKSMDAGSYGVVALDLSTMKYTKFGGRLNCNSAAYAEAWAIWRGLQYINGVCMRREEEPSVLVVTDSKINYEALSKYVKGSWDLSDWANWKKSSGGSVKNQDLYRNILTLIGTNGIKWRVVHVNSHLKESDYLHVMAQLRQAGVSVDERTAKLFIYMNRLADEVASSITLKEKNMERSEYGGRGRLKWELVRTARSADKKRSASVKQLAVNL